MCIRDSFYSINGIKYFFNQVDRINEAIKLAVMGPSSALYLEHLSARKLDFIFSQAERPLEELNTILKNQTIGFVQSKHSLKSVEKEIYTASKINEIVVYDNLPRAYKINQAANILVFTSPLNVGYYAQQYPLSSAEQIFAIGPTTASKIKELSGIEALIPQTPTETALYDIVRNYLSFD